MKKVAEASNDYYQLLNWYSLKLRKIFTNNEVEVNYIAEIQKSNIEFCSQFYKKIGNNLENFGALTNSAIKNIVTNSKDFFNMFNVENANFNNNNCDNNIHENKFCCKYKDHKKNKS